MIEIGVLGPLLVRGDGEEVVVAGRRERCVLGVLALRAGHAVSAATLLDFVWGDDPPRTALKSLQTAVTNVRRALRTWDDGIVETTGSGYLLAVERDQVDVGRFEELVADGRAALHAGAPEVSAGRLVDALALWRGDGAADFGDGLQATIESSRLSELRLEALADRVDADLQCGRHSQVLPEVTGLTEAWPLRERIHELLMLALYRSGRQSDALAAYERLRMTLLDKGLEPSAEVRELERRILDHDPDLAAPAASAVTPRSPIAHGRASTTRLFGRDEMIQSIRAMIRERRLISLVGPGGVGKTALAQHFANDVPGLEPMWCGLGAVPSADDLVPAVATVLGVDQRAGVTMLEAVCDRLRVRPTLLVLDNCEHLLDPVAALVESLLRDCESLVVLATSRERLSLPGEVVRPVDGLETADDDGVVEQAGPAVALFVERARESDPHFDVGADALAHIAAICRRLDGLPLAIELAAARVRALPLAEIARRLDDRFTLLASGRRGADERHHSLRATVAWSHELLAEREQRLFSRVGTFAGAFSLEAAEAVGSADDLASTEVSALLADLVDKSMVSVTRAEGMWRYRLLETLRDFARQQLDERGEREAIDRANLAYHADLMEALALDVAGSREDEAVQAIEGAFDNVRQGVAIARRHGDADGLARLIAPLMGYLHFRPRWEASTWADQALDFFARTPPRDEHNALIVAAVAAWGHWYAGDLDRAESIVEEVLASASERADLAEILVAHTVVLMYRQDPRAFQTAEGALGLVQEGDRHWLAAYLAGQIAIMHAYAGEPDRAELYLGQQAELVRSLRNHSATAWSLYCQAEVSGEAHPPKTIALARQGVEEAVAARSSLLENVTRITAVTVEARHGDVRRTLPEFAQLIDRFRRSGAWTHLMVVVWNLVEAFAALDAYEAAAVLLYAAPEAAPTPYGDQLARMDDVRDRLKTGMDEAAFTQAAAHGSLLTREQVAEYALAGLSELLAV